MTREDEWMDSELRALESLERETMPPGRVEERVVEALADRGLLTRRRISTRGPGVGWRLAAAVLIAAGVFAAGLAAGRNAGGRRLAPHGPTFALFLFDEPRGGSADEAARVAEYRSWASGLRRGRFVAGEKLGDDARLLTPAGASAAGAVGSELRGYFVVEAPDLDRAVEIARSCPHLKHGGRVLVRPIVPT